MRKAVNTQRNERRLTRRQYTKILAGATAASLAGCTGDDDTGTGDGAQRDSIRAWVDNSPQIADMNEFASTDRTQGELYMTELTAPNYVTRGYELDTDTLLDGHEWDATWIDDVDTISIPTVFTGYDIDPPFDVREHIRGHGGEDPLTYWDGTVIDADAFELQEWMWYYTDDHHLNPDATPDFEAEDDFVFHWWQARGDVPGQDPAPRNEVILEWDATPSHDMPMHPDFLGPYVERYEDVETEDDTNLIHEDLQGDRISFERYADEGWGSGLYELDPETITSASMSLFARDDHPNEHWTIPEMQLQFAEAERWQTLAQHGQIDIGEDIVQEEDGVINRTFLPDHLQEIDRYTMGNGDHWVMNWNDPHLSRLWVRRAIVAAIDWNQFGANGWGSENSIPNEWHTCLTDPINLSLFDEDFLDELYVYPVEQDLDTAAEWLERAGYSGSTSGGWEGPEGRDLEFVLDVHGGIPDWSGAYETAQENLQDLGILVELDPLDGPSWQGRMGQDEIANPTYTMGIQWSDSPQVWNYYNVNGDWWTYPLVGGDPDSEWAGDADPEDLQSDLDNHGRPFVQQVPTEPGAFDAPDEAGRSPDVPNSEEVNLAELCYQIREPGTDAEEFTEICQTLARYANYYVPFFTFHTYPFGYWANVQDFHWPERGHPVNRTHKEFDNTDYHILAGIAQLKYDDEFPDP